MLKKTITFNDLDGNPITEDFYFSLSKAEIAEMELSRKGGFSAHLQAMIAENDGGKIVATFKDIITKTVGRRSDDGRRFIKSEEITNDFLQTDAYSTLFMELLQDGGSEAVAQFIRGIMPADMQESVGTAIATDTVDLEPAWVRENRDPSSTELQSMTAQQLQDAFRRKNTPTV